MKLTRLISIFTLLIIQTRATAQDREQDPLLGNYRLGNSAEIVLLWAERSSSSSASDQRIYDFLNLNNPDPNVPDELLPQDLQGETGSNGIYGDRQMDVITGDFNGDSADDLIGVWEGPDQSINMIIPSIDKGQLNWSASNVMTVPGVKLMADPGFTTKGWLRLAAGHLDDDPEEEFVLAYWAEDSSVTIKAFDTNGTLSPVEIASISDVFLPTDGSGMERRSARFDITTGDLDGDFTDEIILVAGQLIPPSTGGCDSDGGCWKVVVFIYDYDAATRKITRLNLPEEELTLFEKTSRSSQWLGRVGVAAGDFDGDTFDEIAVGIHRADNSSASRWYLSTIDIAEDLSRINSVSSADQIDQTNGSNGYPMCLVTGDLDQDGDDELLYAARQLKIYDWDSELNRQQISGGGLGTQPGNDSHRVLVLADLDAENSVAQGDSVWSPEIVVVQNVEINSGINPDGEILMRVLKYTPGQFNLEEMASYQGEFSESSSARGIYLAAGDFGNNGVRVGKPQRFTKTDIVEPIVILNAPPTHFDVFDGTAYDVTKCYGSNSCEFKATYQTQTERTIEMDTEFHSDWSVGAKVSGGFEIPILEIGVKAELKTRYGQAFSRYQRRRQTFKVNKTIDASADDWIYAVITDYDIWEYPLYLNGKLEGYISVVVPSTRERAWFDSKSFSALSYIPSHEVGNILSYQEIAQPSDNSAVALAVRWDTGDRITLNNNSNATWALTAETETETTTSHSESKFIGGKVSFSVPFKFIPDVEISGDYSEESVSTYTSKVRDRKGLSVHFESIDLSFGNTRYAVTPYAYWARNGALVLDYAVKPELPPNPADPATWWSERYTQQPDPAFILPWRYDPEKGLGLAEEAQRFRTRDIIFDPALPSTGDVVTTQIRVQNFSLVPTTGPVKVRFFIGDPDEGGVPIVNTSGQTEAFTETIQDRGNSIVEFEWRVPQTIGRFSRIYAVLDPDGTMAEIHEANNKGWTVLEVEGGLPTSVDESRDETTPTTFNLAQNYPNPFNPATTISFALAKDGHVKLTVFDILGRTVVELIDGVKAAGKHKVIFDANDLSSGLYLYRLETEQYKQVRKMLLVR